MKRPSPPVLLLRKIVQRLGLHPDDHDLIEVDLTGRRAVVIATNHGALDIGKPTGVFASELTAAYYSFLDAGMHVDVASPSGGTWARTSASPARRSRAASASGPESEMPRSDGASALRSGSACPS